MGAIAIAVFFIVAGYILLLGFCMVLMHNVSDLEEKCNVMWGDIEYLEKVVDMLHKAHDDENRYL